MYAKIINGTVDTYPYTIQMVRQENPLVSFPDTFPESVLAAYDVYPVTVEPDPVYNRATKTLQIDAQPVDVAGTWTIRKTVVDKPLADAQAARLEEIRTEANQRIEDKWPQWMQNNVALGLYQDTTCADDIAAVIAASNVAEDAIEAATTVAEVEAVSVSWPVI